MKHCLCICGAIKGICLCHKPEKTCEQNADLKEIKEISSKNLAKIKPNIALPINK